MNVCGILERVKRVTVTCCLAVLLLPACGKKLEHQIRDAVRTYDSAGLNRKDVEILSIQESGNIALAEVKIKTAFKLKRSSGGDWIVEEVRLADGRWEKSEHILRALERERAKTTTERLDSILAGIERYRDGRGRVPDVENFESLIDVLAPGYLQSVVRLDGWARPFHFQSLSQSEFDLRSSGPDGVLKTPDDLIARSH